MEFQELPCSWHDRPHDSEGKQNSEKFKSLLRNRGIMEAISPIKCPTALSRHLFNFLEVPWMMSWSQCTVRRSRSRNRARAKQWQHIVSSPSCSTITNLNLEGKGNDHITKGKEIPDPRWIPCWSILDVGEPEMIISWVKSMRSVNMKINRRFSRGMEWKNIKDIFYLLRSGMWGISDHLK